LSPEDFDTPGDVAPRPHGNCYWVLPGRLLAGEHPGVQGEAALPARLMAMQAAGIQRFIDLTAPADPVPAYQPYPVGGQAAQRESHPITDFGVPTDAGMHAILDSVRQALARGERLYLHCKAGIGRTGTVVACILVDHGFPAEEALAVLQRKWQSVEKCHAEPLTPETDAQRAFVLGWAAADRRPR
jgi:atypical dual specificity phosphatase